MKLNDSITTYDIAEALQGEQGKFEVTSPTGERYFVTCQPGHSEKVHETIRHLLESEPVIRTFNVHSSTSLRIAAGKAA